MFGYRDISIELLTDLPWLAWPTLLVLVALAVWLYRRTNPPLPAWRRVLMATLRLVAVSALMLALLEPVFGFSRVWERPARVSLLLDYSQSMEQEEDGRTRAARRDSLLSSAAFARLADQAEVRTYYFADRLAEEPDALEPDRTALGEAVAELARVELGQPADYWLVFSDGKSNSGRRVADAATGLPSPVLAVDLAAEHGSFDIALDNIDYNPVVFAGKPTRIEVRLAWQDAENRRVTVRLLDGDRVLATDGLDIRQPDGLGELTLTYTPSQPGQRLLTIEVPVSPDERTPGNNRRTIPVKVLKSRLQVLLAAEAADYELGFLHRYLRRQDRYEVKLALTGDKAGNLAGRVPENQTELNRYDLIIWYDPEPSRLARYATLLHSYLADRGGAVWLLMGERFSRASAAALPAELLPFAPVRSGAVMYREFRAQPEESQLFHPAIRLADDRTAIRDAWNSVPPFELLVACDSIDPQAVILARVAAGGPPLMGYRVIGAGKVFATAALPFWTWGFVTIGLDQPSEYYGRFIEGVIRWLTEPQDFDPIALQPEKQVYHRGEVLRFRAHAFDQGYRPIPDVVGTVRLSEESSGERFEADLVPRGAGNYEAEFTGVPPGTYTFEGRFEKDGSLLKRIEGRLRVEEFSLEMADPGGDPATLQALARLSGGRYITWREFGDAIDRLDVAPRPETRTAEFTLWGRSWLLMVFLAALTAEWLLRKLNQLL